MSGGGWLEQICAGTTELTAESLYLHRHPRSEEIAAARAALDALDDLAGSRPVARGMSREVGARALYDPRLIGAKEPLRRYPPVRVRCRCNRTLDWIAIAPRGDHGVQLVHGPKLVAPNKRRGGAEDILAGVRNSPFGQGSATGTVTWAQDSQAGVGNVFTVPNGTHGDVYALKAHYVCPKCRCEETVLHLSLLRRFLTVVLVGEVELRLGPVLGTVSQPRARRIGDRGSARAWSTRAAHRPR